MSSEEQNAANLQNAQSSTGPHDTSQTSRNATKHGLLAHGITELDQPVYGEMVSSLMEHFQPVGPVEQWLVEQIGLLMVRIQRAADIDEAVRAHALSGDKEHRGYWIAFTIRLTEFNASIGRYETALENKLYRALHELERQQLRRAGERVPAPVAADLNIHGEAAADTLAAAITR